MDILPKPGRKYNKVSVTKISSESKISVGMENVEILLGVEFDINDAPKKLSKKRASREAYYFYEREQAYRVVEQYSELGGDLDKLSIFPMKDGKGKTFCWEIARKESVNKLPKNYYAGTRPIEPEWL